METTEHVVEFENQDGEWHSAGVVPKDKDPQAWRDEVVRVMRSYDNMGGRYVNVRLLRKVTVTSVVGEVIKL